MWTIGVADRLRFRASRASSESGEMLAFAHIPTGTATNDEFEIDEVSCRRVEPASHPLRSEPTSKPPGLHLNNRLRLSHDRGPPKCAQHQSKTLVAFHACQTCTP